MAEAAQGRPTTKLLDSDALPKLDAPTRPFHRLKTSVKVCQSPENEEEKKKNSRRKTKRPLPDKRWQKLISREDNHFEENGMFQNSPCLWFQGAVW